MHNSSFRRFILLWLGQLISAVGGGLSSFGLGVYIFERTGSAANMALVTLLGFLPTLVLSVPAGVLADRFDRRLLMMLGDGLAGFGILYILICMMDGGAPLTQICIGVFISAVFSSLMDPAYKATVSDLLTEDEFSKASGLVSLAGSARYLLSPVIAGVLLSMSDIKLLLLIDILTFVITVLSTFAVRKTMKKHVLAEKIPFGTSLRIGWDAMRSRRGVLALVLAAASLTLFVGVFQILAEPLVLSMADAKTLGIAESVCASGMLASSLYLGIRGIKSNFVRTLSVSLAFAGICIIGFGLFRDIRYITASGFAFFMMIPFANNCLDYLVRTNIPVELQGRVWGIVGFLSQIGYVIAYGCSGLLADAMARITGIGVGRASGIVMVFAGAALIIVSISVMSIQSIRELEKRKEEQYDSEITA